MNAKKQNYSLPPKKLTERRKTHMKGQFSLHGIRQLPQLIHFTKDSAEQVVQTDHANDKSFRRNSSQCSGSDEIPSGRVYKSKRVSEYENRQKSKKNAK